ncbi:hypothetical protein ACRWQL_02125 [Shewanella sp. HL-SH4]|jgi:hypothetical protein|uniref:hypothetical protein n=1 Tax=Shewanella sp. HL-SH4 TaxID=3436240 RepID=UPI003EBF8123
MTWLLRVSAWESTTMAPRRNDNNKSRIYSLVMLFFGALVMFQFAQALFIVIENGFKL